MARKASTARIIIQRGPVDSDHWPRFVALFCFIFFYAQFVRSGSAFCLVAWPEYRKGDWAIEYWSILIEVASAIVMYLCGRSLWRKGRFARWWLVAAIVALLGTVAAQTGLQESFGYWGSLSGFTFVDTSRFSDGVLLLLGALPWIAVLTVALARSHSSVMIRQRKRPLWVIVAVAWCLAAPVLAVTDPPLVYSLASLLRGLDLEFLAIPLAVLCPILTAFFLLAEVRWARLTALLVAVAYATDFCRYAFVISTLVHAAIEALFLSSYYPVGEGASPYPFGFFLANDWFFQIVFVDLIMWSGPWIVIALYAWRVPMRMRPDDGSPYPRRYCGHCDYNLFGVSSARCPECGYGMIRDN